MDEWKSKVYPYETLSGIIEGFPPSHRDKMLNFTVCYLCVFGYSLFSSNWTPIAIVIGVITACLIGCLLWDKMVWEK